MIWQHLAADKNKVVKEPKPPLPYVRGDVLLGRDQQGRAQ